MLKAAIGAVALAVLTMMIASTTQQGCQDVKRAWTHLDYYPVRDMRYSIVLKPQRTPSLLPDTLSVAMGAHEAPFDRARLEATFTNPMAASDSAVARGERKFKKTCVPCHGVSMKGDGPVAAL